MENNLSRSGQEMSPIIKIVDKFRPILESKLVDYRERKSRPGISETTVLSLEYRITILEELLERGEVNIRSLFDRLRQQNGNNTNLVLFGEACNVIRDYATTGGENNR